MSAFQPRLDVLPPPQLALWPELAATPDDFTLYGGTALALRLGHRFSMDFDFFSDRPFDPDQLAGAVPYLIGAERVQVDVNTLTCRVERGAPVLISFFNPLVTLKALTYFDDVSPLPAAVRKRLSAAVSAVDPTHLPTLTPHKGRGDRRGP